MPKHSISKWAAEEARKRAGDYRVGDYVAQDYKMNFFYFRSYVSNSEIDRFLTEDQKTGLMRAPKILLITLIGDDGMAVGFCYKENVNNDDNWEPWQAWEQHRKITDGPDPGDDEHEPWYEEQASEENCSSCGSDGCYGCDGEFNS